ncbi:MAG: UDP-3-O-(3-hydroxymyristoyl)glucosamine N-acyltransferase [Elusimicrobiota bacterium]
MKITLSEIAKLTGAELDGDGDAVITGAAGLDAAAENDISFLENPKYASQVAETRAAAVFLPPSAKSEIRGGPKNRLYSEMPKRAYAAVLGRIYDEKWKPDPPGISPKADVHFEARLGTDVVVGPFAVVRGRTLIGERSRISAQAYIGRSARIGKDCLIHPQVVIGDYCEIGDRVVIHSGTVIGGDGFGFWTDPKTGVHTKVAQVGRVVVEDDVEIGCNVAIDRATTGETRIGAGTKIDNLVQMGHNTETGRNCLIISQVGVSGSTKLGHQVVLAGQAGLIGHLKIGDGAVITAQTGVISNVEPKTVLFGSPGRPYREAMKIQALLGKLPDMYSSFKKFLKKPAQQEAVRAKR